MSCRYWNPHPSSPLDKLKVHTTGRAIGVVARTLEVLEQVIGPEMTHNLVNNGHQVKEQGFWRNGKLTKKTESWDCDSLYNYVSMEKPKLLLRSCSSQLTFLAVFNPSSIRHWGCASKGHQKVWPRCRIRRSPSWRLGTYRSRRSRSLYIEAWRNWGIGIHDLQISYRSWRRAQFCTKVHGHYHSWWNT